MNITPINNNQTISSTSIAKNHSMPGPITEEGHNAIVIHFEETGQARSVMQQQASQDGLPVDIHIQI